MIRHTSGSGRSKLQLAGSTAPGSAIKGPPTSARAKIDETKRTGFAIKGPATVGRKPHHEHGLKTDAGMLGTTKGRHQRIGGQFLMTSQAESALK